MGIEYYAFALFIAALICLIAILFKLLFANLKQQRRMLEEKEKNLLQLYQTVESIMDDFNDQIATAMDDIREYESRAAAYRAAYTVLSSVQPNGYARQSEQELPVANGQSAMPIQSAAPVQPTESGHPTTQGSETSSHEWVVSDDTPARAMTVDSTRIRAAGEVLERAERMIKSNAERSGARQSSRAANGGGEVIQRLFDDSVSDVPASGSDVSVPHKRRDIILALHGEGKSNALIAKELGITQNEVKLVIDLGVSM